MVSEIFETHTKMPTQVTFGSSTFNLASEQDYDESSSHAIDVNSGMKLWECSVDLCVILEKCASLANSSVLELGCGHGIPGLVCLSKGSSFVHFQDYSLNTLEQFCKKSILLNNPDMLKRCAFTASTWDDFKADLLFDLVICSEGIYSVDHFPALARILSESLAPNGSALFAGKRYYFGCGGGTMAFSAYLAERGFKCEVITKIENGRSNIREILEIRK